VWANSIETRSLMFVVVSSGTMNKSRAISIANSSTRY